MSEFKVPYTKILEINPHPGADRLELASVYGFQIVVSKGTYKVNDCVIFIPVDSILPKQVEEIIFPPDSKIKLNGSRVRQIRIRKYPSQGLILNPNQVSFLIGTPKPEQDLAGDLGIIKFEPPAPKGQNLNYGISPKPKALSNPYFRCFNGIDNINWFPNYFKDEEVVIQEKLHGTHVRFGKAPFVANTWIKKLKKFLKIAPKFEFVYGSNNVELTNKKNHSGFYGSDIYGACLKKFDVINKIKDGEFVHGEIIGPGIQKGYTYGHKEHHLVIFDVRTLNSDGTQSWMNPEQVETYAMDREFNFPPVLYLGPCTAEVINKHTSGPSVYSKQEKIREGCVVKARFNYDNCQSKRVLKSINPDYLDGDHGDNH